MNQTEILPNNGYFKLGYRPELDGLRAIAVLAVMLGHSTVLSKGADLLSPSTAIPAFMPGGNFGVDVFFVLSGFLITTLLLQETRQLGKFDIKAFYIRRALRLLPAMALLLLGCSLYVIFFKHSGSRFDFFAIIFSALYVANFVLIFAGIRLGMLTPTWSLSVEEQFYSLWPLALSFLSRLSQRRAFKFVFIAAICAALLRAAAYSGFLVATSRHMPELAMNFFGFGAHFLLARADSLLCGALVAMAACWGWLPTERGESHFWRNISWVAAIVLTFMLFVGPDEAPPALYFSYTCAAVVPALLIAGLITSPPRAIKKFLRFPPLVWTGRISYGLYLYHMPIYCLTPWPSQEPRTYVYIAYALFAVAFGITFLIATASYYLVERRFLAFKDRLTARRISESARKTWRGRILDQSSLSARYASKSHATNPSYPNSLRVGQDGRPTSHTSEVFDRAPAGPD
jgi:peptidoglycan/LPS O-acetylase OafA/YrhL